MAKKIVFYYNLVRTKLTKFIWDRASRHSSINGVCLVFHHVSRKHLDTEECCQCTPESFINIIESLKKNGFTIISVDKLESVIEHNSNQKFSIITFDDVPADMYENAYPYLKRNNIPFTVFITTSFLDKEGYLSSQQLKALNNDPLCTIGAHTKSHPLLRFCSDKYNEIVVAGDDLERIIGKEVKYFAYPFGSFFSTDSSSMRVALRRYKYSFSTIDSFLNDYTSQLPAFLPRKAISTYAQLGV